MKLTKKMQSALVMEKNDMAVQMPDLFGWDGNGGAFTSCLSGSCTRLTWRKVAMSIWRHKRIRRNMINRCLKRGLP